ncbi:MAG: hypothetical protein F2534_07780 [Actinobacteria bacterium]|uniref:Unannotated protein n=1 Tax=freshwater metagenome TaxID=449393 RepID=A0A6J6D5D3_9ZZZZ|nr:hypothetical protein [Actinomycetota bacterium]
MRRFEWNALRPGDHVAVHDDRERGFELLDGEVVIVQTESGLNDVAVRVTHGAAGDSEVLRPRRSAVHLVPIDHDETCWRCGLASAA